MSNAHPTPAFHFLVSVDGGGIEGVRFQEVSGLELTSDSETYREGGENPMVRKLPKLPKTSNVVARRAVVPQDSGLLAWCRESIDNGLTKPIEAKGITVRLVDRDARPMAAWKLSNAYPVKWDLGVLNANKPEIVIESIEFAFGTLTRAT